MSFAHARFAVAPERNPWELDDRLIAAVTAWHNHTAITPGTASTKITFEPTPSM